MTTSQALQQRTTAIALPGQSHQVTRTVIGIHVDQKSFRSQSTDYAAQWAHWRSL